eukprot:scaffold265261_cov32-Tisochrysis_lutea.AAC.2
MAHTSPPEVSGLGEEEADNVQKVKRRRNCISGAMRPEDDARAWLARFHIGWQRVALGVACIRRGRDLDGIG